MPKRVWMVRMSYYLYNLRLIQSLIAPDFAVNCESDGYPINHVTVTTSSVSNDLPLTTLANSPQVTSQQVAGTSYFFASPANPSQQMTQTPAVYTWQSSPTTVTNGNTVVWYGGSSFGASVGISVAAATGTDFPAIAGSTVVSGFAVPASGTTIVVPESTAGTSSASGVAYNVNTTDTSLNPQNTTNDVHAVAIPFIRLTAIMLMAVLLNAH